MCWRGKGWSMFVVSTNVSIASNSLSCNSAAQILVFNSVHANYFGHVDCWRSSHGEIFPLYLFVILYVWLCCWWVYSSLAVEAWPKFWVWAPMCIHSFYHLSSTANLTFDFNSASVASHGKYKILTTHSDSESIWHTTNYYIESPFWLFSF